MGVIHKPSPEWATHIPVLLRALELIDGPVLELGMGPMSTPLLHMVCADQDRMLVSLDSESQWVEMYSRFRTQDHTIELVEWDKLILPDDWAVVLIDHKPALQRRQDIKRLTNSDYLIVHDSNATDEYYGYEEIYPLFKYRYTYTKFANQTTVLSNKHDVKNFLPNPLG